MDVVANAWDVGKAGLAKLHRLQIPSQTSAIIKKNMSLLIGGVQLPKQILMVFGLQIGWPDDCQCQKNATSASFGT